MLHLYNIQGCIEKHEDLGSARSWLARARIELKENEFSELIHLIYLWSIYEVTNRNLVDDVLGLLAEFDAPGDKTRRDEFERIQRQRLAEERTEAERQWQARIRAEHERLDLEERERVRARQAAEAERERAFQEELQREADERKCAILTEVDRCLQADFLSVDGLYRSLPKGIVSEREFGEKKEAFVRKWFAERTGIAADAGKITPDAEQLAAIAAVNGHIQVVARAGSGKTATLVNRTIFLLEHCHVAPESVLLLAFNRKAATEIRRRLLTLTQAGADQQVRAEIDERAGATKGKVRKIDRDKLEADAVEVVAKRLKVALPHVMTFHALAYAIVHPEESLLYNAPEGDAQGLSRAFQTVVDDHFQSPEFMKRIRELMMTHFREDWERIVNGRYDQSKDELLRFRRSLPRESLGGDYVKSFGEKLIADFLFEHDISYKYERNHYWSGVNYRPDFTIFKTGKGGLIIEYFGLAGDPDYDEMSREKRTYWRSKADWTLLEFSPADIASRGQEAFKEILKQKLEQHDIVCHRLSEDEIWHRVRGRAIDRFTTASVNFVGRCRKQSLSPNDLVDLIAAHEPLSSVETLFLGLAHTLYAAYLERLTATGEDDFDGLMQRAASAVSAGCTKFQRKSGSGDLVALRFVCIDEFQDFADLFYRLLCAIRQVNPRIELFCVGDDWQAINGFAGSDLRFFERFDEYVGGSRRLYISTNYRSSKSIVTVGNALMSGLGKPAVAYKESPGAVLLSDAARFRPSLIEQQRHQGDIITPMVSRIAKNALAAESDLVVLSRRNTLPWYINFKEPERGGDNGLSSYLNLVRSLFPKGLNERISVSTTHSYKGLEKPTVIVVDAVAKSYPLIHPDWVFSRVFGDSPEKIAQEERRLFYVALTRAIGKLVIITDGQCPSPFLDDLRRVMPLQEIDWDDYPPVALSLSRRLVVKVGNQDRSGPSPTLVIKDQLKAAGYQWRTTDWPGWAKTFPADGFRIEQLQAEIWAGAADGIEVRIHDEFEEIVGRFFVNGGQWEAKLNRLATVCSPVSAGEKSRD